MAKVRLDFTPPSDPDIAKLHIFESTLETGPYAEIEVVTLIGAYPNYITRYTTSNAVSATHWFSIAWETAAGIIGDQSAGLQGGTRTLVHEIMTRVLQRDASLNEAIVVQSAEFVIATFMHVADPYDLMAGSASYKKLEGLTLLTLARSMIQTVASGGSSDSYTAGLVSQKASTTIAGIDLIEWLTKEANKLLGISNSLVMLLEDIDPIGIGTISSINLDESRLAVTISIE